MHKNLSLTAVRPKIRVTKPSIRILLQYDLFLKTQEMCHKAVNTCFIVFSSVSDWYKSQEMCERVVSEGPFVLIFCND